MKSRLDAGLGVGELKLILKVGGSHCPVVRLTLWDAVPCTQAREVLPEHPEERPATCPVVSL